MQYLYLLLAILGELIGTTFLKASKGFTVLGPTIGVVISYVTCFFFFSKALNTMNLGVAYATWSGVGILAATLISILIFKESLSLWGGIGIVMIIVGAVLVNFFGPAH